MATENAAQPKMSRPRPKRGFGHYVVQIVRVIVGVLFIFSGLIKANDPLGLVYKMQEFFEAWHVTGLSSLALFFAIALITIEILVGIAILLGYFSKIFVIVLLILTVFFGFLTGYAALSGNIKECGCFGNCIPLTSLQSFEKDLILLVFALILLAGQRHIVPIVKMHIGTSIMILCLSGTLFIQWYALQHLPYYDCLPYRVGSNLWQEMQLPPDATPPVYQTTYHLKNTRSNAVKEMTDKAYIHSGIWKDTTWKIVGEPEQKLIKAGTNLPEIQDFHLLDSMGNDHTEFVLKDPGYSFLFFIKDVRNASTRNIKYIQTLIKESQNNNVSFYILSSSPADATRQFLKANQLEAQVFSIDATVCKTALRTNPGLMLIKAGVVKGKWSFNDYPTGFSWKNKENMKLIFK